MDYEIQGSGHMKIGYARVSTKDQNLDLQYEALKQADCDLIFEENISGAKTERPELQKVLHLLKAGDTLVVYKLDRLSRSTQHLIEISNLLSERKANLQSTSDDIDTTTSMGKLFFTILGAIAQFERDLIIERTRAGLDAARKSGKKLGPKQKVDPKTIRALVNSGIEKSEVQRQLKISRATLYRALAG